MPVFKEIVKNDQVQNLWKLNSILVQYCQNWIIWKRHGSKNYKNKTEQNKNPNRKTPSSYFLNVMLINWPDAAGLTNNIDSREYDLILVSDRQNYTSTICWEQQPPPLLTMGCKRRPRSHLEGAVTCLCNKQTTCQVPSWVLQSSVDLGIILATFRYEAMSDH